MELAVLCCRKNGLIDQVAGSSSDLVVSYFRSFQGNATLPSLPLATPNTTKMTDTNTSVYFISRPSGLPVSKETFEVKTGQPIPKLEKDGDVLLRNINLSLDPAMVSSQS